VLLVSSPNPSDRLVCWDLRLLLRLLRF